MTTIAGYEVFGILEETRGAIYYNCMGESEQEPRVLKKLKSKRTSAADLARFNQTYEKIQNLKSPGTVKTLDVINQNNDVYLVQERFEGISLKAVLENEGPFGIGDFLDAAIQLSRTVEDIHEQNLSHLGINPRHILVNRKSGLLKLASFGIETVITQENDELFNAKVIAEHLPYLSPEQTGRMNRTVDYRSDMYSLGIVFYEMLTGSPPFVSLDPLEVMYGHIAQEPMPPIRIRQDIFKAVSDIILKLLCKNAEDRYQSAKGLRADLEICKRLMADTGDIEPFGLGAQDISTQFSLPQTLYGRQEALDNLMAAFNRVLPEQASETQPWTNLEIVLVTGRAGTGKSVLIQEICKPITARRGYFVSGKFDQFQRETPYSAVVQVFRALIRQILKESDERIERWKQAILEAVGSNGKIITSLIPDVEMIIGPQPDVIPTGPKEARDRATDLLERFMGVFAQKDQPLVIFFDDLHWADRASLDLLKTIMQRGNIRHIFFIGSFREEEVDENHTLIKGIKQVQEMGNKITTLRLDNLTEEDVTAMVRDVFHCSEERARPLAALVNEKTNGNPFFVGEFLQTLFNEQLVIAGANGEWSWDMESIEKVSVTDNVVSLMAERIQRMPDYIRETLKICACVGHRFNLRQIAFLQSQSVAQVLTVLSEAEERGIVSRVEDDYTFTHNRIHEAAYSLIPEAERPAEQYRIGKLMLDLYGVETLNGQLFEITDHLNLGVSLAADDNEKIFLSRLNLNSGRKAKVSNAYGPAADYLAKGMALLPDDCWDRHYDLTYQIHAEAIEVEALLGNFEKVEQLTGEALEKCRSIPDKAIIYQVKIAACIAQEDIQGALVSGVQFAELTNTVTTGTPEEIQARYERLMSLYKGKSDEDILSLPQMTDPLHLAEMEVWADLGYALYNLTPRMLVSGTLLTVCEALERGLAPQTSAVFGGFAITLIALYGDIDQAWRFGNLAMKLAEMPQSRRYQARTIYYYNTQIRHWKEHVKHALPLYLEGYKLGIETGDHLYAADNLGMYDAELLRIADNYFEAEKIIAEHTGMIKHLNQKQVHSKNLLLLQYVRNLIGKCDDPMKLIGGELDADRDVPQWEASNNRLLLAVYWNMTILLYMYMDRISEAGEAVSKLGEYLGAIAATTVMRDYAFVDTVYRASVYHTASEEEQANHRAVMDNHLASMENWVSYCEDNNLHRYQMAKGMVCHALGQEEEAVSLLEKSIAMSKKYGFILHEMQAHSFLFQYYKKKGNNTLARAYLSQVVICANRAGVISKIRQLKTDYAGMFDEMNPDKLLDKDSSAHKALDDSIDFKSVLKASQVISGEVALDGLLTHMMRIVMENAGATKGITILNHKGELRVEAEMGQEKTEDCTAESISIEDHPGLSPAIVSYAARTREIVILNNAVVEGDFINDTYVLEHKPKSILCYPIVNQARLIGLLYLENTITTNAFTHQGVEVLGILASQIAISITNAQFYGSLENKVRQRTRELNRSLLEVEEANAQIMSSLGYASMMQSSLLPSEELVRQALPESFIIWKPRDIVGGDMYHLERVGDHVILTVVDCTGHGVPGALMTMIAGSGLRLIISGERETDPAIILAKLNRFAKASLKQDRGNTGTDDGMDAAVCSFSMKTGRLTFAGARLQLYVVDENEVKVVKGDRHSLGYNSSKSDYVFTRNKIEPGRDTMFYLATDGYLDQLGSNPRGRLGSRRFKSVLTDIHTLSMNEKKQTLLETLAKHKGDRENTDDVTVVGFRLLTE